MIVDAHTHIFPPEVIEKREEYAEKDTSFSYIYKPRKSRMVSAEGMIEEMDRSGVDAAVVCGFPWTDAGLCRLHNDYMIDSAKKYEGRLVGLATVNPAGNASTSEVERCLDMGLAGVGEISADAQGFSLVDRATGGRLWPILVERNVPALLHVNEAVGHFYPGKTGTTPREIYEFLVAYPEVTCILAHWGGGLLFYELMEETREAASNTYYDTAASPFLYDERIYDIAVRIIGSGRIFFGSDYPLISMSRHIEEIEESVLNDGDKRKLLGENSYSLFGSHIEASPV